MRSENYKSIRELSKVCVLSEYSLRKLARENALPCVYAGRKCLVDVKKFNEMLDRWTDNPGEQPRF